MQDIPVYVVPDNAMPRYGEEVKAKTWQERLGNILAAIQNYRQRVPVYMPFKPGTPTLQKQAQDWARTVQEAGLTGYYQGRPTWEREYAERRLAQALAQKATPAQKKATPAQKKATPAQKVTATDIKNFVRGEYMDKLKKKLDKAWAKGGWAAAVKLLPVLEAEIYSEAPEIRKAGVNPQDLIDYIYRTVGGFTKENGKWVLKEF